MNNYGDPSNGFKSGFVHMYCCFQHYQITREDSLLMRLGGGGTSQSTKHFRALWTLLDFDFFFEILTENNGTRIKSFA